MRRYLQYRFIRIAGCASDRFSGGGAERPAEHRALAGTLRQKDPPADPGDPAGDRLG